MIVACTKRTCVFDIPDSSRDVAPMLGWWWATVCDAGPPLTKHLRNVSCLVEYINNMIQYEMTVDQHWANIGRTSCVCRDLGHTGKNSVKGPPLDSRGGGGQEYLSRANYLFQPGSAARRVRPKLFISKILLPPPPWESNGGSLSIKSLQMLGLKLNKYD